MTVELLHSLFTMAEAALCWQISCKPAQGSAADQGHSTIEYYACSFRGKRPLRVRFHFRKTINLFDLCIACISFRVIRSFTDHHNLIGYLVFYLRVEACLYGMPAFRAGNFCRG